MTFLIKKFDAMGNKKQPQPKGSTFNLEIAHFMADDYMRMADRAIKRIPQQEKLERSASIYVAISSLAFAIEVYLKSILFSIDESTKAGHDLEKLWNSLPELIQTWLSDNFDKHFDSESKKWAFIVSFSPKLRGLGKVSKVQIPNNTAFGMIQGHRVAFQQGRYAYQNPPAPKLKHILYNIDGLQLLAWLTRSLAIHTHKEVELAKKTGKREDVLPANKYAVFSAISDVAKMENKDA